MSRGNWCRIFFHPGIKSFISPFCIASNLNVNGLDAVIGGNFRHSIVNDGELATPSSLMQAHMDTVDSTDFYRVLNNTSGIIMIGNKAIFPQ